jgi:lupus La protein
MEGQTNLPVKVEVIHKFNRMKKYEYADVVAALRDSVTLDVTGPQGLEEVRRKVPFDPKKDFRMPRTVYVKGFGDELPSSQFDIEAFFAQYGPTNSVRLRRTDDKFFKGSCYIEFQDEETAQSFLALDPKPLWKGKHELEIMSLADYLKRKNRAIDAEEAEPNATRPYRSGGRGGRGGGYKGNRDRRDAGDRDPDDWKKRREDDQKSGFRDNRRDRDNRRQNGRGGRGRGRGNDRDRRNNDRNSERDHKDRYG